MISLNFGEVTSLKIPTEVLASETIPPSAKLVIAVMLAHPYLPKKEVANMVGISRRSLFRNLRSLKAGGIELSAINDTISAASGTNGVINDTPHPVGMCNTGNEAAVLPAKRRSPQKAPAAPPTEEEVQTYAAGKGRADMAFEFYDHYRHEGWLHNGEPLANWKRMFDAWAKRRPKSKPAAARVPTLEEALYEVDKSY